jgi:hypothetical protein
MAILNIIFGSLGLLCMLCNGVVMLGNAAGGNRGGGFGGNDPAAARMMQMVEQEIPAYMAVQVGALVIGLTLAALMLISGIGLLYMQNWARIAAIVYAITDILLRIGNLVYYFAFVSPVMSRALQQVQFRQGNVAGPDMGVLMGIINVTMIAVSLVIVIYDVILLVFMLVPGVVAAFGQRAPEEAYEQDRYDEEEDELGRDRRRREDWNE